MVDQKTEDKMICWRQIFKLNLKDLAMVDYHLFVSKHYNVSFISFPLQLVLLFYCNSMIFISAVTYLIQLMSCIESNPNAFWVVDY